MYRSRCTAGVSTTASASGSSRMLFQSGSRTISKREGTGRDPPAGDLVRRSVGAQQAAPLRPRPGFPHRGVDLIMELLEVLPEHLGQPRRLRVIGGGLAPRAAGEQDV